MKKIVLLGVLFINYTSLLFTQNSTFQNNRHSNAQQLIDQALNISKKHQEFKELDFKQNEEEFIRLVREGQNPQVLFIGCSDSRVVPDLIIGTRPGDLFVIRNAGNFVPLYTIYEDDGVAASIEYAVQALNVRHIVVCGHSHCGAIAGLFQNLDKDKFAIIKRWLRFGNEAKIRTLSVITPTTSQAEIYKIAEEFSILYQLEHLMTYPFIQERIKTGKLHLHGWYAEIETGNLLYYDGNEYRFKSVNAAPRQTH